MRMRHRVTALASLLTALLMAGGTAHAQLPGGVQVPGLPTSLPGKDQLLGQAKQMVTELTSLKGSGKLTAEQAKRVDDDLLPRANSLTGELSKPQIETSKLGQLSRDVTDLQQQVTALKGLVK
jgi:polyhydroxyalkanoate synthesis regulator phasin